MKSQRPKCYLYWNQLIDHIGSPEVIFNGELVWPRQFEIHLPSNHIVPCNLHCGHCAGGKFDKSLGNWEIKGLRLLDKLNGAIPFHIYGGAYTEPLLNPYLMAFLAMTKKHGNHFGIHTNATVLLKLEEIHGWIHEMHRISTDNVDYLSIAIDGATSWSWGKSKCASTPGTFWSIIDATKKAIDIREKLNSKCAIRLTYLMNEFNGNSEHIGIISNIAKEIKVDSLRFAIPFAQYNQSMDAVRGYKRSVEVPMSTVFQQRIAPYLSTDISDIPFIWWAGPEDTDVDKLTFKKCAYTYYQITYGADGYCYRCSTVATPTMAQCRLGEVTDDLDELISMIKRGQNIGFDAQSCFDKGARCNRMGFEVCQVYEDWKKNHAL